MARSKEHLVDFAQTLDGLVVKFDHNMVTDLATKLVSLLATKLVSQLGVQVCIHDSISFTLSLHVVGNFGDLYVQCHAFGFDL